MAIKEITVESSKQVSYGEFSARVSITFSPENDVPQEEIRAHQALCREAVKSDIENQIREKKERTKKGN